METIPRTHDEIVDRLVEWSIRQAFVRALWLEGAALTDVRRPYSCLQMHVAVDEPDFERLLEDLPRRIREISGSEARRTTDTARFAREIEFQAGGLVWTLIAERTSMLAKRPRAYVIPLVDRTNHLTHVMDFSLRPRAHG